MVTSVVSLVGTDMLKIDARCFNAAVCLSPIYCSGMVRVVLRRVWVRYTNAYVDVSYEDILGRDRLLRRTLLCLRLSPPLHW